MLTEVLAQEQETLLRNLIAQSSTIVLCCHQNADGDALGSMLGWGEVLRQMGKDPLMVVPDQYPDYLQWLPNTEKVVRYDKRKDYVDTVLKIADLVFCLDFNTLSRTSGMEDALKTTPADIVLIDHHLDPDVPACLTISYSKMSSTSELVFRIAWQLGLFPELGKHFAISVYTGMMTDTGGFTFNSNDPAIFFIISQLLTKHINKDKIYRNVYHNYSEHRLRMVGFVLCNRLVVDEQNHAAYYTLSKDDQQQFHFITFLAVHIICNNSASCRWSQTKLLTEFIHNLQIRLSNRYLWNLLPVTRWCFYNRAMLRDELFRFLPSCISLTVSCKSSHIHLS